MDHCSSAKPRPALLGPGPGVGRLVEWEGGALWKGILAAPPERSEVCLQWISWLTPPPAVEVEFGLLLRRLRSRQRRLAICYEYPPSRSRPSLRVFRRSSTCSRGAETHPSIHPSLRLVHSFKNYCLAFNKNMLYLNFFPLKNSGKHSQWPGLATLGFYASSRCIAPLPG